MSAMAAVTNDAGSAFKASAPDAHADAPEYRADNASIEAGGDEVHGDDQVTTRIRTRRPGFVASSRIHDQSQVAHAT
jgi:hypothetical protein